METNKYNAGHKQWHEYESKTPCETNNVHIYTDIIETEEYNDKGQKITTYTPKQIDVFEKVNETAKIMKKSNMQELLEKIQELEKGV